METIMKGSRFLSGMAIALACTTSYAADSDSDLRSQLEALKAQVAQQQSAMSAQQSEISQLRAANGDSWLTERRANEVKALVREVLSDADTRASLADGGVAAGYKGGHFFIGSDDGNFLLTIWGLEQFRYVYNYRNQERAGVGSGKKTNSGFENARTEIGFAGHLFDPKFTYAVDILFSDNDDNASSGGTASESGEAFLQNAWAAYEFADGWQVKLGQFRAPFLRETLVGDGHQLAVDRGPVDATFTVGYTQGIQLSYTADMWRAMVMIHDGANAANTDWESDSTDVAVAARAEFLLAGKWAQFADFATWSGDSTGILIGAGVDYENPVNSGLATGAFTNGTQLRWTVDASVELPQLYGLNIFAAVVGNHIDASETFANGQRNADQWGLVVQAGVFVIPDKLDVFARWDHIDLNGTSTNNSFITGTTTDNSGNFVTVGSNYYFKGHSIKATVDGIWSVDRTGGNDQLGLLSTNRTGEFAVRAQFQFMF
jgi:hypothetical protein